MRLIGKHPPRKASESGSALMAVVAVMAVTMILTLTIAGVTMNALSVTVSTRAGVQAEAAAAGGVDATLAALQTTAGCTNLGAYSSTGVPTYQVQVSFSVDGTSWTVGCPTSTTVKVKIVSTGTAAAKGIPGASSADTQRVEAVYAYTPASVAAVANPGSAVYSYASGTMNTATLVAGSAPADVLIKTGAFNCTQTSQIGGNVVVAAGNATIQAPCQVVGSVLTSGAADIHGTVQGDVLASGSSLSTIESDGNVTGSLKAGGNVTIAGDVGGNVEAGPGAGTSTFFPGSLTGGYVKLAGVPTTWATPRCTGTGDAANACTLTSAGLVQGTVAYNVAGLIAPAVPVVPNWVHYPYTASVWTTAGFTVVPWAGSCTVDNTVANQVFIKSIMAYTTPVVVDAQACSKVLFSNSAALQFKLKSDVAIISKNFGIEGTTISSFDATPHKLWFIVPDNGTGAAPGCTGQSIDINSSVSVTSTISAMIYTPCSISNSTNSWRGQLYAGAVNFNSQSGLVTSLIGLPGINLVTGAAASGSVASPATVSTLISFRNLASV